MSAKCYAIWTNVRKDSEASLDARKDKNLPKGQCSERSIQKVSSVGVCRPEAELGNINKDPIYITK